MNVVPQPSHRLIGFTLTHNHPTPKPKAILSPTIFHHWGLPFSPTIHTYNTHTHRHTPHNPMLLRHKQHHLHPLSPLNHKLKLHTYRNEQHTHHLNCSPGATFQTSLSHHIFFELCQSLGVPRQI